MVKHSYRFWVYILANATTKVIYIGVTDDLSRRVWEHKHGMFEKSFTIQYNVNKLVYYEEHSYILNAIKREKLLKRWRRSWKDKLIKEGNPLWEDLTPLLVGEHKD